MEKLHDLNISNKEVLSTPYKIRTAYPMDDKKAEVARTGREDIQKILEGDDNRYFFVVGPCSIHDPKIAIEYAQKLKVLADKVSDKILIVMRVYFEKPRTTVGWKGLINDPHMNNSYNIEEGLRISRKIMLDIVDIGLPIANEALDPVIAQYVDDVVSWSAIGARTVESQTHRQMASGLSCPVGLKNPTNGDLSIAYNALQSVKRPHNFVAMDHEGNTCIYTTHGNKYSHMVLRGGEGPNYDKEAIDSCTAKLEEQGLLPKIMVDCSHANSYKDHTKQINVLRDCIEQIKGGNKSICSFMVESNLEEGNQSIPDDIKDLKYGVSITDKCISWDQTVDLIEEFYTSI